MSTFFLIAGFVLACPALYLLGNFLFWLVKGRVARAKITGFQDKTDKKIKLPLVLYKDENGNLKNARAERIDQFLYILNRPAEGDYTTIIHRKDAPHRARIHGYINVTGALLLLVPFLIAAGLKTGQTLIVGQTAYVFIFGMIALGGWLLLKVIQRYY